MPNKSLCGNFSDNFSKTPCAQQQQSSSFPSCTLAGFVGASSVCNNMCDFICGSQPANRNQVLYTPSSLYSYPDQLDTSTWIPDPRAVADIEKGLRFTDKMETIEITSKDLSPASCCSNIDLLIPDFYKTSSGSKECSYYNKPTVNDSQWYCNQKYLEYPSCAQTNPVNTGNFSNLDKESIESKNCYNNNSNQYAQQNVFSNIQVSQNDSLLSSTSFNQFTNDSRHIFYPQNDSVSFDNIDIEQQAEDGSNDESDIIVEESDEEVTDYSEDLEKRYDYSTNCIVCNVIYTPVGSQFYILTKETPLTMSSQEPVFSKLTQVLGEMNGERNYLCSHCLNLVNTVDHLQIELDRNRTDLCSKYEKTCKENNIIIKSDRIPISCAKKTKQLRPKQYFKCKLCRKSFSVAKLYFNHMTSHKTKNGLACKVCGKRFSKLALLRKHSRAHVDLKSTTSIRKTVVVVGFTCKLCDKLFRTKTNLKDHVNYCSGSLPYSCDHLECDKRFATITKLRNHVKLKHDKKFIAICSICNIGFVKMSDYKTHRTSHSTEKRFHCKKCDKSYKTLSNLNYHNKFHDNSLPFTCTICQKGFMRKEYLESHVNNHNGLKNFSCSYCDKKFVSQKNLDSHLKYHEGGIKKKTCNVCNKVIATGFNEHVRIHGNLKEFECISCTMKFNTKGALAKHKKRKHHSNAK